MEISLLKVLVLGFSVGACLYFSLSLALVLRAADSLGAGRTLNLIRLALLSVNLIWAIVCVGVLMPETLRHARMADASGESYLEWTFVLSAAAAVGLAILLALRFPVPGPAKRQN